MKKILVRPSQSALELEIPNSIQQKYLEIEPTVKKVRDIEEFFTPYTFEPRQIK